VKERVSLLPVSPENWRLGLLAEVSVGVFPDFLRFSWIGLAMKSRVYAKINEGGQAVSKSFWKERSSEIWSFFCPQCKIPRRVPYRAKPSLKHYAQIGLTAAVFTLATWTWFNWKGIVVFLPLWVVFETLYRSRVRAALSCEQCGFDPILYLVDVKRARQEIEDHWKKKFAEKGIPYPVPPQRTPNRAPAVLAASANTVTGEKPS
jgi:hypothetical protein